MLQGFMLLRVWFGCLLIGGCLFLGRGEPSWASSALELPNGEKIVEARLDASASQLNMHVVEASHRTTALDNPAQRDTISGQVWKDLNWDGLRQLSDPFIPNTLVSLYPLQGNEPPSPLTMTPLLTTTTTITGWYQFTELAPGAYFLDFLTPGAMFPTLDNQGDTQGTDEAIDSDIVYAGEGFIGRYAPLVVMHRGLTFDVDAGFVSSAQVTAYIYEYVNQDNER